MAKVPCLRSLAARGDDTELVGFIKIIHLHEERHGRVKSVEDEATVC